MLKSLDRLLAAIAFGAACTAAPPAVAIDTDGYHTIQIVPVVVQTGTFASRIIFHNPVGAVTNVAVFYYPGNGTAQASSLYCGVKVLPANRAVTYATLSALCPGLAAGNNFGWLYTYEVDAGNRPYRIYTRISNFAGNGFSVESAPAHTFTAADHYVVGLRRLAAAAGQPPYQSNCFVGALFEQTTVVLELYRADGTFLASGVYPLAITEFVRLLDVFTALGAPAGDYDDVTLVAWENQTVSEPGAIIFCTVQDNVSFGADFRFGSAFTVQDDHVPRHRSENRDALGALFAVGPWPNGRNRHVVYFKHPDWVQCGVAAGSQTPFFEFRLVAPDGSTVLAGGSSLQSFGEVFLGNKGVGDSGTGGGGPGMNRRYFLDVETDGTLSADGATYSITCESGSGHSHFELVGRNLPDEF